ncbi:hypothetical protein DL93DRAFT_2126415 [Clavulina sp. PMI_390]|nr:hypothetical protein DL93DRAFT_2126415 [Clavulina sp. PMI_390]
MSNFIRTSGEIQGIGIRTGPNTTKSALLALFADDATAFLSENDKPSVLLNILDIWCLASGAKFNIQKTVAIPVGTAEYRRQLIETRKLSSTHMDSETIAEGTKILKDGESTRILGAHLGNKINVEAQWAPVVGKINVVLDRWNRNHLTMIGRKIACGITIHAMTQFLTRAVGMPENIENKLQQKEWRFIWGIEAGPTPIAKEFTFAPHKQGGLQALELRSRNEAIELMKLKQITRTDLDRPLAASHRVKRTKCRLQRDSTSSCSASMTGNNTVAPAFHPTYKPY